MYPKHWSSTMFRLQACKGDLWWQWANILELPGYLLQNSVYFLLKTELPQTCLSAELVLSVIRLVLWSAHMETAAFLAQTHRLTIHTKDLMSELLRMLWNASPPLSWCHSRCMHSTCPACVPRWFRKSGGHHDSVLLPPPVAAGQYSERRDSDRHPARKHVWRTCFT